MWPCNIHTFVKIYYIGDVYSELEDWDVYQSINC